MSDTIIIESDVVEEKKTWKDKIKEMADVGKAKFGEGVHWVAENSVWAVPVIMGSLSILGGLLKSIGSKDNCMDPDELTGERLKLERPLVNKDIVELSGRMNEGQTKAEALDEMGLLKNEKRRKK